MDSRNRPQMLAHISKSLTTTIYDTLWVPSSARFVLLGSTPRTTGTIQICRFLDSMEVDSAMENACAAAMSRMDNMTTLGCIWEKQNNLKAVYELNGADLNKVAESEKSASIKCGTFGASSLIDRQLATGDFKGNLHIWDLEKLNMPVFHVKGHESIINAIDGCGGLGIGYGAPEIVTAGRDGRVCVWDQRQKDDPVVAFEPERQESARDCWTVAFGNSYNDEERCILAGYDNGDIKLFDLKMCKVRWETSTDNGVCSVQFDRKDIKMNKCVATTLESKFHVFDLRTQHPEKGFACLTEKMSHGSTIWGVRHLPQNREVFAVLGGDGSLSLHKYHYPEQRSLKDMEGKSYGIVGKVSLVSSSMMSTQPINCFDWSPDKEGLAVMGSFDQCVRVVIVTKLNKL